MVPIMMFQNPCLCFIGQLEIPVVSTEAQQYAALAQQLAAETGCRSWKTYIEFSGDP